MSDIQTLIISEFELENGKILREAPVAYQTWGALNDARDNVILLCHALTGDTDAASWWEGLVGPGCVFDTDRFFVICPNVLGSPYGSASPLTIDPETEQPYGAHFPRVTIRDTVRLHRRLLDHLDVQQVALAAGGSMGGMQVLEWAFYGDFVRTLLPVAVNGRHAAWQIGWSEAQRQAIYADPHWQDGHYDPEEPPQAGLASARMAAMVSYRSPDSFKERFARDRTKEGTAFAVESYLHYQGQKLVDRFDANCYVQLTRQMDTHDVARERGDYAEVLRSIQQPTLVVGIDSDVLYPVAEQEELANYLPEAELSMLHSPHGHDAFLIETGKLAALVRPWMQQQGLSQKAVAAGSPSGP